MKRICILLCILLSAGFWSGSFAEGEKEICQTEYQPDPTLAMYLANSQRIMEQIRVQNAKNSCGFEGPSQTGLSGIARGIFGQSARETDQFLTSAGNWGNELLDFSSFFSSFEFYILQPALEYDVPEYVYRDQELLERHHDKLLQLGKQMAKKCSLSTSIKVDTKLVGTKDDAYVVDSTSANEELKKLIQANAKVLDHYRRVATGHLPLFSETGNDAMTPDDRIYPKNLFQEIYLSYGSHPDRCSSSSSINFLERVKKAAAFWNYYQKSTENWKQAWALLKGITGTETAEYKRREAALLRRELTRQGVSGALADKIMKNLTEYNGGKRGENYIESIGIGIWNTVESFGDSAKREFVKITDAVRESLGLNETETVSVVHVGKSVQGAQESARIATELLIAYRQGVALIGVGNDSLNKLQSALVTSHRNLRSAQTLLENAEKSARSLCNSQGSNITEAASVCAGK